MRGTTFRDGLRWTLVAPAVIALSSRAALAFDTADPPAPPHAQSKAPIVADRLPPLTDTISFFDGRTLHGRIVEIRNDVVVILLEDGRVHTIPRSALATLWPSFASNPAAMEQDQRPRTAERDLVRNHEEGRVPVVVESAGEPLDVGTAQLGVTEIAGDTAFEPQCLTPCVLWARPSSRVEIMSGGRSRRVSRDVVDVPVEGTRIVLRSAAPATQSFGIAFAVVGGLTLATGALLWGLNVQTTYPPTPIPALGSSLTFIGLGLVGASVALLVIARTGIERQSTPASEWIVSNRSRPARRPWFVSPYVTSETQGVVGGVTF
jgi:hypothetical protein